MADVVQETRSNSSRPTSPTSPGKPPRYFYLGSRTSSQAGDTDFDSSTNKEIARETPRGLSSQPWESQSTLQQVPSPPESLVEIQRPSTPKSSSKESDRPTSSGSLEDSPTQSPSGRQPRRKKANETLNSAYLAYTAERTPAKSHLDRASNVAGLETPPLTPEPSATKKDKAKAAPRTSSTIDSTSLEGITCEGDKEGSRAEPDSVETTNMPSKVEISEPNETKSAQTNSSAESPIKGHTIEGDGKTVDLTSQQSEVMATADKSSEIQEGTSFADVVKSETPKANGKPQGKEDDPKQVDVAQDDQREDEKEPATKIEVPRTSEATRPKRFSHHDDDSFPDLDDMSTDEYHNIPQHVHRGAGGIRWAPWDVPLTRRLQTLMVLLHCLSIVGLVSLFFWCCAIPIFWPIMLIYVIHVLHSKASTDGSLRFRYEWFRRLFIWKLFAGYFPAKLHKTQDLPPTRKYIFGYHPHGIISHGGWAAFATEALGFSEKFPGITNCLLTLDSNFRIPFYREYIMWMGVRSVSKESIVNILTKGGANREGMGRAVTIVIGGARESLEAQPGQMRLILKERKGFIKIAVRTGADLVPVLAFGENDLYEQLQPDQHPLVHKLQMFILKVWRFTLPFLHGRGIFNYDVGLMPYRRPLNIVVGAPIKVMQSAVIDMEEIDRLHGLYVAELEALWNRYKDEFATDRKEELQILP